MNNLAGNSCNACGKQFRDERDLKRHQNRKTPCVKIGNRDDDANRCIYCNKVYSNKYNLAKHSRACKMKNGGIEQIPDVNIRITEQLRIMKEERELEREERDREKEELRLQNEKMERELAEIKEFMKTMSERPMVVNNSTINNTTINNNITIYNQPNIDFLLQAPDTVRRIINEYGVTLPMRLITPIWYSDKRPENHSVIVDPKKPSQCKVHCEFGWETRDTDETAVEIRKSACDVAKTLLNKITPEIRGVAGPIEDSKWCQDRRAAEENAEVKKKMIAGSRSISSNE